MNKLLPLAVLAALALSLGACANEQDARIVIYHTNDVHGWILPRKAAFYKRNPQRMIGGCAALSALLKSQEARDLLLDAGDWFQGTPEGGITQGRAPMDCFNTLGYDAVEVGNHEFDNGEDFLKTLAARAKMPVLGANVYDEATGRRVPWLQPHVVKTVQGVKVGIFGLLTTNMRNLAFPKNIKGLKFRREVDEAKDQVAELRAEGVQVVIALTHVGYESGDESYEGDKYLASQVPGLALIVGGHSHTRLEHPWRDPEHGTLVVQAGSYLANVGKATLIVDRATGRVVDAEDRLYELWLDRYGEDAGTAAMIGKYEDEVGRKLEVVVATAAANLERSYKDESALGDWITDCMRKSEGADLGFQNSGGIRESLPAGPVTLRELYNIMPFDNRVVTLKLTGAQVKDVLVHGTSGAQGLMQVSGVQFALARRGDERVRDVKVGGKALDPNRLYSVATTDFLVNGGDGYKPLGQGRDTKVREVLLRDLMASCAREQGQIKPPPAERMHAGAGKGD